MSDDTAKLLALLEEAPPDPKVILPGDFRHYFSMWAVEFGWMRGGCPAMTSNDFFRHFHWWGEQNGYVLPKVHPTTFGSAIKSLGLFAGRGGMARSKKDGRDLRLHRMDRASADYCAEWLKEHPRPQKGQSELVAGAPKLCP